MTISTNTRTRVVVLLTSVALALVLLLAGAVVARADDPTAPVVAETTLVAHTVLPGDTLWDIAGEHVAQGDDVRNLIEDIKRINDLDSSVIVPGQVLQVPLSD